jgi:predicted phage baseplate assembly protein
MSRLEPDRIERRYAELVEIGHSRLPALAPRHTDHNAHDPGITLMEMLAAVAEAQLYSAGRIRRDERDAYAALLGVRPRGTRPARGLLWPDRARPDAPANTFRASTVIDGDASIHLRDNPTLQFRPVRPILWAPGELRRLALRGGSGAWKEYAALNERGVGFLPFGEAAGPNDVLVMTFETLAEHGLYPVDQALPAKTCWAIGVRVAGSHAADDDDDDDTTAASPLSAVLVTQSGRHPLPIVEDTSAGMLRTGYLLLDLSGVKGSPASFSIEWRAPRGHARAARVLHLEPNVLPVTQRSEVRDELPPASGLPGFTHQLEMPGLCFEPGIEPVRITSRDGADALVWRRCDDLATQGPEDRAFELDTATGRVRFGNGINGMRPAAGVQLSATYAVSDGDDGNVARNRLWTVAGIEGSFGSNRDAVTGGAGRSDRAAMRRKARQRFADERALVSADDIRQAAERLPLLGAARSWIVAAGMAQAQTATLRLVAMRARDDDAEPAEPPETPRWLEAVRRALAPRMPLGTRLAVVAPRYRGFSVRAAVAVTPGSDPTVVCEAVRAELVARMRLVPRRVSDTVRAPGVPVTLRDVSAWILGVPGVADVASLALIVDRRPVEVVTVAPDGLPRLDIAVSSIDPRQPTSGVRA